MTRDLRESEFAAALREDIEGVEWATVLLTSGVLFFGFVLGVAFFGMQTLTVLGANGEATSTLEPLYNQVIFYGSGITAAALVSGFWLASKD